MKTIFYKYFEELDKLRIKLKQLEIEIKLKIKK